MKLVFYTRHSRTTHKCTYCNKVIEKKKHYIRCVVFETLTNIWACKFHVECWGKENYLKSISDKQPKIIASQANVEASQLYSIDPYEFI